VAETRTCVNRQVLVICRRIESLGLELAEEKTEIVLFHGKVKPDVSPIIRVGRTEWPSLGHSSNGHKTNGL